MRYVYYLPINLYLINTMSLIINFTDGYSFDGAVLKYAKIQKNRTIFTLSVDHVHSFLNFIKGNKIVCGWEGKLEDIKENITKVGYDNVMFNFDCCSSYGLCSSNAYHFIDKEKSINVIDLIDYVMSMGSTVVCSDFSLKALIFNWNNKKWGKCPFINIGVIDGDIMVKFGLESTKKSRIKQLAIASELAIPDKKTDDSEVSTSHMIINASKNTIIYGVVGNPEQKITVQSVMVGKTKQAINTIRKFPNIALSCDTGVYRLPKLIRENSKDCCGDKNNENLKKIITADDIEIDMFDEKTYGTFSLAESTRTLKGLPVHSIVEIKNYSGLMIVSNLHFVELVEINTSEKMIIEVADNIFGKHRSEQIKKDLATTSANLIRSKTQGYASEFIKNSF